MSAETEFATGPFCGTLGCRDDAVAIVADPEHGPRAACPEHVDDQEVIRRVE